MEGLLRDPLRPVPFSRHPLWDRQRRAYSESGPEVFRKIPNAATNNPVFASQVATFLVELKTELDILEIGCGTGQFAYYLVRELYQKVGAHFRYRLYDLSPQTRAFLRRHRCWQSWLERGVVSVEEQPSQASIVLGNYLLGSLAQERVRFRNGRWQRALVAQDPFEVLDWEDWEQDPGPAPEGEYLYPVEALQLFPLVGRLAIFSGKGHLNLSGDIFSEAHHGEVTSRPTELEFITRAWEGAHHYLCDSSPLFASLLLDRTGSHHRAEFDSPVELIRRWESAESLDQILSFLEEVQGFPQALCDLGRRVSGAPATRMLEILRTSEQLHYPLWPGHSTHQRVLAKLFEHFGDPAGAARWKHED